jgi:hypothetical protein
MATSISPFLGSDGSNFTRQFNVETIGGDQRQRLAEMLRSQALNQPQGQMVSGWYVPPSWSQNLAQLANTAVGVFGGRALDEERAKKTAEALKRFEGVEEQVPMENIPGVGVQDALMAEGQSRPEGAPMQTMANPEMMQQRTRMRPLTQDEQDMALLNLAQINPQVGGIYGQLLGTRATRAERAAEKAEQRAFTAAENEKNRQAREDMMRLAASMRPGPTPASEKPLNEFQGKSVTFGTRAAQSHNILKSLEDTTDPLAVVTNQKGGILTNWMMPANVQRVDQAQRDFVNAVLRQESGAAIGATEFDNARKQYFPQPGDKPEQIEQKRLNREMAIKGFARQAGPAGVADVMEVFNAGAPNIAPAESKPTAPAGRLGGQTMLPPSAQGGFSIRPKQ